MEPRKKLLQKESLKHKMVYNLAIVYPMILWILLTLLGCNITSRSTYSVISGQTMGTYYRITIEDTKDIEFEDKIDSILYAINSEVSTYEPHSIISRINGAVGGSTFDNLPHHFEKNLEHAFLWYDASDGYLDVSLMPLVNYWGFGYQSKDAVEKIDSIIVDSLFSFVGLNKWEYHNRELKKTSDGCQLDFSSLAKGYAVDQLAEFFESLGINNFLIDIGGEATAKGVNQSGNVWVLGIATPKTQAAITEIELKLKLKDASLATSGNYRNFHISNGVKYGHTINPMNGFPYQDRLLSTTIIAKKCIDADAVATACMAMGLAKATTFIENLPEISACFLVGAEDGSIETIFTNGFIQHIIE